MTTHDATLDGEALQFETVDFNEEDPAEHTEHEKWRSEDYYSDTWNWCKRKLWTLRCVEHHVDWTSSAAYKLGTAMFSGGAAADGVLSFIMDKTPLHSVGTVDVWLLSVDVGYRRGKNIREFTLQLEEKQY